MTKRYIPPKIKIKKVKVNLFFIPLPDDSLLAACGCGGLVPGACCEGETCVTNSVTNGMGCV